MTRSGSLSEIGWEDGMGISSTLSDCCSLFQSKYSRGEGKPSSRKLFPSMTSSPSSEEHEELSDPLSTTRRSDLLRLKEGRRVAEDDLFPPDEETDEEEPVVEALSDELEELDSGFKRKLP